MIKKNIAIGAVVLIAIVAVVFVLFSTETVAWDEDWLPTGQTNDGITGTWIVEPYLVFEDGTKESLKEKAEALWMEDPSGNQVTTIEYVIKAQATRDTHEGTYTSVDIDISDLTLNARFYPISTPSEWMDVWEDFDSVVNIPFNGATQTAVTEVASFNIPVDITDSNGWLGYPLPTLPCDTVNEMTENWVTGTYTVQYSPQGSVQFRGVSSDAGDGDWKAASLPGTVSHGVTIGGNEVNMDWSSDITYS